MERKVQERADARFEQVISDTNARDPRDTYRQMLREIRTRDEATYRRMVDEYEENVIRAIAEGADPLETWLRFGLRLAEQLHPGRTVVIDEEGRARPYTPPPSWKELTLHLPNEGRIRALPVGLPPRPSIAQEATVDLLCQGKLKLPDA